MSDDLIEIDVTEKAVQIRRPERMQDEEWKKASHVLKEAILLGLKTMMMESALFRHLAELKETEASKGPVN